MDAWVDEIQALEEKTQALHKINPVEFEPLDTYLLSKYVDDVITALEQMKQGVKWDQEFKCFKWSPEKESQDRQDKISPEISTMSEFTRMASGIFQCLEFTFDSPASNTSGQMPVLDTTMWIQTQSSRDQAPRY